MTVHPFGLAARNLTLAPMTAELDLRDEDFKIIEISGLPHYLHVPSGWSRPVVSGGDGPDDPPKPDPDPDPDDDDDDDDDLDDDEAAKVKAAAKRDQKKLDRAAAKAAKAERKKIDDYLKAQKAVADEADLEGVAKDKAEAAREKAEAAADRATAKRERLQAKVERKLSKAGVDEDALEDVAELVKLEDDADADDIDDAIKTLKKRLPGLFDDTGKQTEPKVPPTRHPKKPRAKGGKTLDELGQETAIRMGWIKPAPKA